MDFFYQAIKRAAGVAEVEVEPLKPRESRRTPSPVVSEARLAVPELDGNVTLLQEEPFKAAAKQRVEVKHPLSHLVAFLSPPVIDRNIAAMEQCRIIRTRLSELVKAKEIRTLMITSALQGEGKTTIAVNLAYALSQIQGMKILLVDADLRRPYIADFLKIGQHQGLDRFLLEKANFDEICWGITPSLDVVPTAGLSENSAELLHGDRMKRFLVEASSKYDLVLLDAPPLFPIVDAQVLAQLVNAAVLVVRANSTPFDLAREAADLLKPKLIGSILNGAARLSHNGYYEYQGYGATNRKK